MAARHRPEIVVTAGQNAIIAKFGDSPKGAADADSLEKLFLQAVGNKVRCIGVDATGDVL